jgi:hypothetical protein
LLQIINIFSLLVVVFALTFIVIIKKILREIILHCIKNENK